VYKIKTYRKKILADTMTPVSIYQKIRDTFSNSILLESSDYGANDNSYAYVCFNPISSFKVKRNQIIQTFPDNKNEIKEINKNNNVISELNLFSQKFKTSKSDSKFFENGIIGYMNYDAVKHFEKISRLSKILSVENNKKVEKSKVPLFVR
jgi:anthranilate synthase component 1